MCGACVWGVCAPVYLGLLPLSIDGLVDGTWERPCLAG